MSIPSIDSLEPRRLFSFVIATPTTTAWQSQANVISSLRVEPDPEHAGAETRTDFVAFNRETNTVAAIRKVEVDRYDIGFVVRPTLMLGTYGSVLKPAAEAVQGHLEDIYNWSTRPDSSFALDARGRLIAANAWSVHRTVTNDSESATSMASFGYDDEFHYDDLPRIITYSDGGFALFRYEFMSAGEVVRQIAHLRRYNDDGSLQADWSYLLGTGAALNDQWANNLPVNVNAQTATPGGSTLLFQVRLKPDGARQAEIQRIRADGTLDPVMPVPSSFSDIYASLIASNADAYLVGRKSITKINLATGTVDPAFATDGGARFTNDSTIDAPSLDLSGKLIVDAAREVRNGEARSYPVESVIVTGAAEASVGKSGKVVLRADGTLDVYGTANDDVIDVRLKNGMFEIQLNSRVTRFLQKRVTGIVVRAGAGNDRINVYSRVYGTMVFGQAGDDTIVGSANADLLSGGEGRDSLTGRFGADSLFGGEAEDVLIASELGSQIAYSEFDNLIGGAGADRIFRSSIPDGDPRNEWLENDPADFVT